MLNTTPSMVATFRNNALITFPMLLNGSSAIGTNMNPPYGERDNYVIISPQRTIRYNAQLKYGHGNRYHLAEMQSVIDSLLFEATLDVDGTPTAPRFALQVAPNPAGGPVTVQLTNPTAEPLDAEVVVHDLAGRRVATPWRGSAPAGTTRVIWDGTHASGRPIAAGVYLVRARIGDVELSRRIVRVR